jgi:hypothetical protein
MIARFRRHRAGTLPVSWRRGEAALHGQRLIALKGEEAI